MIVTLWLGYLATHPAAYLTFAACVAFVLLAAALMRAEDKRDARLAAQWATELHHDQTSLATIPPASEAPGLSAAPGRNGARPGTTLRTWLAVLRYTTSPGPGAGYLSPATTAACSRAASSPKVDSPAPLTPEWPGSDFHDYLPAAPVTTLTHPDTALWGQVSDATDWTLLPAVDVLAAERRQAEQAAKGAA